MRIKKPSLPTGPNAVHIAALSIIGIMAAEPAFAQSAALAPLEKAMDFVVTFLTGAFGKAVAIVAVISLGFLALFGRLTFMQAGFATLGIGLIFGSTQIVTSLQSAVGTG